MRKKAIESAKTEARRFLEKVAEMERAAGSHDYSEKRNDPYYNSGMFTAKVRRASMDLSRALADVRRG